MPMTSFNFTFTTSDAHQNIKLVGDYTVSVMLQDDNGHSYSQ